MACPSLSTRTEEIGEKHRISAIRGASGEEGNSRAGIDPRINEAVADQIEKEWVFRLQRAPENVVTKVGLVKIIRKSCY